MRNRLLIIVTVLMIVGLALRYWLFMVTDSHTTDGIAFLSTAEYMRDPAGWPNVPKRITMPLYPFLVFVFSHLTGGNVVIAGRWVSMCIGIGLIPLVFILARKLFDERVAVIAAILTTVDWMFIVHSTSDRADILFAFMTVLLAIYFWKIDWRKTRIRDALLFGLLMGLTQLTRTNGVLYFSIFFGFWIFHAVKYKIGAVNFILRTLLPVIVVYSLLAGVPILYLKSIDAPQQSYIGHTFLDGILTAQGDREQVAYKLNEDATDFAMSEEIRDFSIKDIWRLRRTIPGKYIHGWKFIGEYFFSSVWKYFRWGLVMIIPLMFVFVSKRREISGWDRIGYLMSFAIPFLFLLPIMHLQDTFFVPLWPIFLIVLSWFISEIYIHDMTGKFSMFVSVMIIVFVAFVGLHHLYAFRADEAGSVNGYKLAGEYLKEAGTQGDTVMSRNNTVFFYAGMRGYRPPSESLERTLKYCKHMGIDYFILGPEERKGRPELAEEIIRSLESGDTDFELVHTEKRGASDIYVLRILGGD